MNTSKTLYLCFYLLLVVFSITLVPVVRAETLYVETYENEPGFPTDPEVDTLSLGGMGSASGGGTVVAPPLPELTGDRVSARVSSTGAVPALETASTYVDARALLASNVPFEVTGHFENFDISREPGSLGLVAMLLYSSTTGYFVGASLYLYSDGTSLYPSINISDVAPGQPPIINTEILPGIPVTTQAFDLTLMVDPLMRTLNTHLDIGGVRYELAPLALNPATFDTFAPDALTQTLGVDNRNGPGHLAAVDFRGFRVTTSLIRADIDVKPGDAKNVVSRLSKFTTVAVFSNDKLDATAIMPASVTLAGAPVVQTRTGEFLCRPAYVNRDRRKDLLCEVVTSQIEAPPGESIVTLHAFTTDGTPVSGEDHIRLVR